MKNDLDSKSPNSTLIQQTCCASKSANVPEVSTQTVAASESQCIESQVSPEAIREKAFAKWEAAGCPCGNDLEFWLEAETELRRNA